MAGKEKIQKTPKPKKQREKGRVKKFFKSFFGEVRKLSWLSFRDLVTTSLAVLGFIAICAVLIGILDFAFGEGIKLLSAIKF